MRALAFAAVFLCVSLSAEAQIPRPVRDEPIACVGPSGVISRHNEDQTAIYACQLAEAANPTADHHVDRGRFRIELNTAPTPEPTPSGHALLAWTPPTTNVDGSPLTDLAGFKVYWGPTPAPYPSSVTVADPGLAAYMVDGLAAGTWFFVVTAVNALGAESAFSNVASKTIQ